MRTKYLTNVSIAAFLLIVVIASCENKNMPPDTGDVFARSRIRIDGETEWQRSERHPQNFHIPKSHDFASLEIMKECVRSYSEDRNLSGIRGAFLASYMVVNIPRKSPEVLLAYGGPLRELRTQLGDTQFALSLSKMRPEVQSAVFYMLLAPHWPVLGDDTDWDNEFKSEWPNTFALSQTVQRLKWPADYQ